MKLSFHKIKNLTFFLLLFGIVQQDLLAQVTGETYKRAEYFLSNSIQKEVHHLEVIPNWLAGKESFWHLTQVKEGKRFFLTSIQDKTSKEAFDHIHLAELLSEKTNREVDPQNLPFDNIQMVSEDEVGFNFNNKKWVYGTNTKELTSSETEKRENRQGISPDGKWRAFVKNHNLFVENLETGKEIQLSIHGKTGFEYASYLGWGDMIEGENGTRPEHFTVNWSPDSKKIQTQIVDLRLAEKMYLLDFTEEEKYRPKLLSYYRGSPGDTTVVRYIPVLFDLEQKTETRIKVPMIPHFIGLGLTWEKDSKQLTGLLTHRGFKKMELIKVDAENGIPKTIWRDSTTTSLEPSNILFRKLENGQFLISSNQSGWMQLYLHDWETGKRIRQLTNGDFVVTKLNHVDDENEWVYFEATGKEKDRNVYYPHLYRINFDGKDLKLLTPENGYHDIHISEDKKFFVDNYSKVAQPTKSILRELSTGKLSMEISEADISNLLAKGYASPRSFSAIGKDGKTEIFGIYHLPTDFDESKTYPVVDYTYTGPHTAVTPKTFKAGLIGLQQPLAELGFIVVTVDGIGTAGRSKAFRDVSYRNLGDGTTDHMLAIRSLAAQNSFLDLERVGVFGHSAGGYDAVRAMLLHPDFFKVGVASAGDHDHRMEKAWWPEMYMGYPIGDFYQEQSNITNAGNLKGRLLLAHGAVDENVNPSATYKLADALIKAGKEFDMFILPANNHNFGRVNGDYFTKKRWDYFIRHLLGEEPLFNYQIGK
ncbi:hypothetical protein P872_21600 [Rhodonellum psychrophilum GCM71 = DSM 17998]|uniref:Peptidase S9 n=2 Tax=Rhodonellum TaxID=336827 RepID=U5BX35_9BACT|nr:MULTISPECIES: DPP IV N-terminal domain-containing protein [Rhodonellum]ERM80472.1 hypothetical protein P872_21600 [Rhodonellum psychrophilum GCM71 = DSM 17998]SDZ57873.1 Prolyl oligopeptidase family protein [Rhodonellum ikkaensis]